MPIMAASMTNHRGIKQDKNANFVTHPAMSYVMVTCHELCHVEKTYKPYVII
jgi:hypothetical protein